MIISVDRWMEFRLLQDIVEMFDLYNKMVIELGIHGDKDWHLRKYILFAYVKGLAYTTHYGKNRCICR
ncbi:MAG: hypothetical protein WKF36_11940 [Candidatus Nitrosocosmicus sp.]